jgi:hypothetical protein
MGALLGNPAEKMQESMRKTQEEMMTKQRDMMLKQRQLQLAHQFSLGKDRFLFYSAFLGLASIGCILGFKKSKNPSALAPLLPFSFAWIYQYDMYYGNKMQRVKKEAERMIREEPELFLPARNNLLITEEEYKRIMGFKK